MAKTQYSMNQESSTFIRGECHEVSIYDIAKCSRCGNIYKKSLIEKYHRYVWYTLPAIEREEKRLQEHIVSITEAYKLLGKEDEKFGRL